MSKYIDENNNTVNAKSYKEASKKLYEHDGNKIFTDVHKGYAEISVYKKEDVEKIGALWGAPIPTRHTLTLVENEVIKHVINCYEENKMRDEEENLKGNGYVKTSDCMWTKIYKKDNVTVVLNREY